MARIRPISAIVPTFNRAALIERAIDSVLAQTVPPAQVIVVDDGSKDDTAAVCSHYGDRIEYVWQENGGASASRNLGIRRAQHEWVAFLDSDDYWTPQHLERMTHAMEETSGQAQVYFSDMQMPEAEGGGTLWEMAGFRPRAPLHLVQDATAWMLMRRQPTMLQSSVINRLALERIGGLDVRFRLIHDTYAFCQLGIGGAMCAVSGVGCIQTSDDVSTARLTTDIPLGSREHARESSIAWRDILWNHPLLPREYRRLVRYGAAGHEWVFGKACLRSGRYAESGISIARAVALDPRLALWGLRHGTLDDYECQITPKNCPETSSY